MHAVALRAGPLLPLTLNNNGFSDCGARVGQEGVRKDPLALAPSYRA